MRREDELAEQARALTAGERRRLAERILRDVAEDESRLDTPPPTDALDELIALSGAFHSDDTDVSSDKYKHLADTYSAK
jgi:hypothetical protein